MLQNDPVASPASPGKQQLILYVEGPRDREILRAWAYRLLPSVARRLFGASVILGGRRPARAIEHFRGAGGAGNGLHGLCILDRDDGSQLPAADEPGLEFFIWGRRHIESYLLVPDAIRRSIRTAADDGRVQRALDEHLPDSGDEGAYRSVDAKRLIGPKGALPLALGCAIPLDRVARATRTEELHPDVHQLFDRLRDRLGVAEHR